RHVCCPTCQVFLMTSAPPPTPVEAFARWLAETPAEWPDDAVHSAHREIIDQMAVTVAGADEPATRHVHSVVREWGLGPATAVAVPGGLAAPWATLVIGASGHVLDYDDNFDPPKAHATAVLIPAIFARAQQEAKSGADCIDAYICGLQ